MVGAFVPTARRLLFAVLTAALVAALSPTGAAAAAPVALDLSKEELGDLARIETYLNSVKTVRARFMQMSSTGGFAEGDFYLLRPGKMRIEYRPPVPILIIADGTWMIYHDHELGQVSYIPLGSTPAGILVDEEVSLQSEDVMVVDFKRDSGTIWVTVVRTDSPEEGSLTLVFNDNPVSLRKWTIVDAQGIVTDVALVDAKFGVPLDSKLFRFRNPNFFKEEY